MIITKTLICRKCGSTNLVKNGSNGVGNLKSRYKDCGFSGVIQTKCVDKATKEKNNESLSRTQQSSRSRSYLQCILSKCASVGLKKKVMEAL